MKTKIIVLAALALSASACAPLVVGTAMVGSALVVTDRRTTGAQLEDQAIELKAAQRLRDALGSRGNVSATSYNRMVLITGEVPSDADRTAAEQAVARVENVRSTVNELAVAGTSSIASRSGDAIVSGRVKASFLDVKGLDATAIKVVTERGTAYLMGRVTETEANRAADVARGVQGVQKVVKVFELISEAELAEIRSRLGGKN
jgi:osmotically-inducible protein OsmY